MGCLEAPVTMFARADKYERQLERIGIWKQPKIRLSYETANFQTSGQFNQAMRKWHAHNLSNKTFAKF